MKGKSEVFQVLVTPELAKKWLDSNYEKQRNIRNVVVNMYAYDMSNGTWDESIVNPLRFTESGKLIDGQHRLQAVIRSGKEVMMWVQYGLQEKAFESIDIGSKRRPADIIGGEDAKNVAALAVCIAAILYGDAGIHGACHRMKSNRPKTTVPISDIISAINCVDVRKYWLYGSKFRRSLSCGSGVVYGFALWIIGYLYGDEVLEVFCDDFLSDSPFPTCNVVRNYITSSFLIGRRTDREVLVEAILFAYDNFSINKAMKLFRPSGVMLRKYNKLLDEKVHPEEEE